MAAVDRLGAAGAHMERLFKEAKMEGFDRTAVRVQTLPESLKGLVPLEQVMGRVKTLYQWYDEAAPAGPREEGWE